MPCAPYHRHPVISSGICHTQRKGVDLHYHYLLHNNPEECSSHLDLHFFYVSCDLPCDKYWDCITCNLILHDTWLYSVSDIWVPGARSTMSPLRRSTTKLKETSSVGPLIWLVLIMCFNDCRTSCKSHILEGLCSVTFVLGMFKVVRFI